LEQVARQPGVIAVSVFHEGFALQSLGTADFEQVAAIAEDLLRAGTRITADMAMGDLSQMILETPAGKLIIAPHGDLSLCILAKPDANLGLIRLSIRGMQDGPA
ncbi:MAG: roadblock/LC7 domain-containing protein, partial [Methanoculleus sp.]